MKYFCCIIIVLGAMMPAFAAEVSMDFSIYSAYVWRGIILNDGSVFQTSVTLSEHGFSANVWANVDLTDANDLRGNVTEIDYTFTYAKEMEKVNITGGVIAYTFLHVDADATTEVFAGVSFNTILNPSVMVYWDVDEVHGVSVIFSASHTFKLFKEELSDGLTLKANLGYSSAKFVEGNFVYENPGTRFSDYSLQASLPITLPKGTLNLTASYSDLIDSELHTPGYEDDDSYFVVGAMYALGWGS
ncbi:MAG: hypothetical protein A2Y62_01200 [Candidatus Fischerbacteria bacterium RBG_13_37_8]|uniref:Uncharacterized protein n=1 Tax=Candidatus Fischerbacteria bacterium RBG_13_37_8 TaxID=1817863 RepID=A0A1F5VX19_9BACT|nr:MAG: hypothetical protein A2Y62_01200 [Candidatus Fischerbacteria bacterium RBG_13_37_8]